MRVTAAPFPFLRPAAPVDPALRRRLWAVAGFRFVVMEALWRLGFELGIAYFQIHDALTRP